MTDSRVTETPHVRPSEVVAQLSISLDGIEVGTFWTRDVKGFEHKVPVKTVLWQGSTLIVKLDNGQEFEAEFKVSSATMRAERDNAEAYAENREV